MAVEMRAKAVEHDSEIRTLNNKISELEARLQKYEPKEGVRPDYTGYKKDWPNIKKIQFILQRNFGPLTTHQILKEFFLSIEPVYTQIWCDPRNCLAKILGRACKYELIEKVKILGSISFFYKLKKANSENQNLTYLERT